MSEDTVAKAEEAATKKDDNSASHFKRLYEKVLVELDVLYRGVYDPTDAEQTAALCLLAQAPLIRIQAVSEFRARALKRDIDFAKAEAYSNIRKEYHNKDPKDREQKLTEAYINQLINKDDKVHNLYQEQNMAEREAKELTNVLALLKDAHITFRSYAKKEN